MIDRTKMEIVDWLFTECGIDGAMYIYSERNDKNHDVFCIAQWDAPNPTFEETTVSMYGELTNVFEFADLLVLNGKYVSSDFEKIKALLDRVFGSSDSWPDEYCDTLGWRLK